MRNPLGGSAPVGRGRGGATTIDVGGGTLLPLIAGAAVTWTNMPAAETEFLGNQNRRFPFNFDGYTLIRLIVGGGTPGLAASFLTLKYSLDNGTNWLAFSSPCTCLIDALGTGVNPTVGAEVGIPVGARGEVLVGLFGTGGNAVVDPTFSSIYALARP